MFRLIYNLQGTKILQYCTCPAGRVTYNFHSSCKHVHLSFKSICNKEHKEIICYMTPSSNSSQSACPIGRVFWKNYLSFLDFTRNYEWRSEIFVPCFMYFSKNIHFMTNFFQGILNGMQKNQHSRHVQISGSASLFYLVKGPQKHRITQKQRRYDLYIGLLMK